MSPPENTNLWSYVIRLFSPPPSASVNVTEIFELIAWGEGLYKKKKVSLFAAEESQCSTVKLKKKPFFPPFLHTKHDSTISFLSVKSYTALPSFSVYFTTVTHKSRWTIFHPCARDTNSCLESLYEYLASAATSSVWGIRDGPLNSNSTRIARISWFNKEGAEEGKKWFYHYC